MVKYLRKAAPFEASQIICLLPFSGTHELNTRVNQKLEKAQIFPVALLPPTE